MQGFCRGLALCLSLVITLAASAPASAISLKSEPPEQPSFDCADADHRVETMICGDPELVVLDRKLDAVFQQALKKVEAMPNTAPEIRHMKAYELRWSRERNACVKTADPRICVAESYRTRTAELQARFLLVKTLPPVIFVCRNNPKNEIIATFVQSNPPSVRLERGDRTAIAVEARSGSGARYVGARGLVFWNKGDDARVTWPGGSEFECTVRK